MRKNKKRNVIVENIVELQKHQQALLLEKVMGCLDNKGFTFDSKHDIDTFFKTRLKAVAYENGMTVLCLDDGTELCSYKMPIFKETEVIKEKHTISIMFEFTEL